LQLKGSPHNTLTSLSKTFITSHCITLYSQADTSTLTQSCIPTHPPGALGHHHLLWTLQLLLSVNRHLDLPSIPAPHQHGFLTSI